MIAQLHSNALLSSPLLNLMHAHARHFTTPTHVQFPTPRGPLTLTAHQLRQGLTNPRHTVRAHLGTTPLQVQLALSATHLTLTPHPHARPWAVVPQQTLITQLQVLDQAVLQAFMTHLTSTWNITTTLNHQHCPSPHALPRLLNACEQALIPEALPTLFRLLFQPSNTPFVTQLCLGPDFLILSGHPLQRQLHFTLSSDAHLLDASLQACRQRYPNAHPSM